MHVFKAWGQGADKCITPLPCRPIKTKAHGGQLKHSKVFTFHYLLNMVLISLHFVSHQCAPDEEVDEDDDEDLG